MSVLTNWAEEVLAPLEQWSHKCHQASIKLVRASTKSCRVARGWGEGVISQHSWVVIGDDCYDDDAVIIDPTLWSYDDAVKGIWTGTYRDGRHRPHGKGSVWEWGRPDKPTGPIITLTPCEPLSSDAETFLKFLGPLDYEGWAQLAHSPVEFWPAAEIMAAIDDTDGLSALVPVDIIGMLTDRNPHGLYLKEDVRTDHKFSCDVTLYPGRGVCNCGAASR